MILKHTKKDVIEFRDSCCQNCLCRDYCAKEDATVENCARFFNFMYGWKSGYWMDRNIPRELTEEERKELLARKEAFKKIKNEAKKSKTKAKTKTKKK